MQMMQCEHQARQRQERKRRLKEGMGIREKMVMERLRMSPKGGDLAFSV